MEMDEEDMQNIDDEDLEQEDIADQLNSNPEFKRKIMRKVRRRRSIVEQTHDLRILLNRIFSMRGGWVVKNIA